MEPIKHATDATAAAAAVTALFTTFFTALPVIISCVAGLLSIAWYIVRFMDRARAKNKAEVQE